MNDFAQEQPVENSSVKNTNTALPVAEEVRDKACVDAANCTSIDEPEDALPPLLLADAPKSIQDAVRSAGWTSFMPVQSRSLPYILQRRDLMVQSRTGSGKTGAYLLPLLERLSADRPECQALVLVPTRELALQVEHEAAQLYANTDIRAVAVYGGVGFAKQLAALKDGAQLVIGTPGRILDHLLRHTLVLQNLRVLIFDEADRMLSIGFYPDMKELQRYLPRRPLSVYMFSATFPPHVMRLAGEFMRSPDVLSLSHAQVHSTSVSHVYYECKPMEKDRVLMRIIEIENPSSAIIFCNTKSNVHYIAAVLQGFGYNADELSADLSQSKREDVLVRLRQGAVRFLVATDVAARGIDIPELSHVFLYEPPEDRESYIHRAGRTGRAGASGEVISLVDIMEKMELQRIATHYSINLQLRPAPTEADVAKVAEERLTALLEARLRTRSILEKERMRRFAPMVARLAEDPEQVQLAAMLFDMIYQDQLHAPLVVPAEKTGGKSGKASRGSAEKGKHTPSRERRQDDGLPRAADAVNDSANSSRDGEGNDAEYASRRTSRDNRSGRGGRSERGGRTPRAPKNAQSRGAEQSKPYVVNDDFAETSAPQSARTRGGQQRGGRARKSEEMQSIFGLSGAKSSAPRQSRKPQAETADVAALTEQGDDAMPLHADGENAQAPRNARRNTSRRRPSSRSRSGDKGDRSAQAGSPTQDAPLDTTE